MSLFYGIKRPFKANKDNFLNMYNEIVISVVYLGILLINTTCLKQNTIEMIGWILIGTVLLSLAATWILLIPQFIKDIKEFFKSLFLPITQTDASQNNISNVTNVKVLDNKVNNINDLSQANEIKEAKFSNEESKEKEKKSKRRKYKSKSRNDDI